MSRLLLPVTPVVCASPAYAAVHGLPKRIEDIGKHACIGMRSNPSQQVFDWEFQKGKLPLNIEIQARFVVNDPEGLAKAAAAGMGLAQIGSNIALPLVRSGALVTALQSNWVKSRALYAVYPTRRYLPKRVSSLIGFLVDYFSESADLIA